MFLVTDSVLRRRKTIEGYLDRKEPVIAILLAAADCERTIRRAILNMGTTSTKELAHRLGRPRPPGYLSPVPKPPKYGSTIDGYAKAWDAEVLPRLQKKLKGDVITNWDALKRAFQLRHDLIHGDTGNCGVGYARTRVNTLLEATAAVDKAAREQMVDLCRPIRRRLKDRAVTAA
jgi:hypothetical protein